MVTVKLLLEFKYGGTPLHLAATCGHAEIIKLLLKFGANVHAPAKDEGTPYMMLLVMGNWKW
jgi:ankyrin repeat protein